MDPDGLSILIFTLGGALALVLAFCAGALCANDSEKEQCSCLGFSSRMAGICICLLIACAFFVFGLLRTALALPFVLLCFLLLCAGEALCFALGGTRHGDGAEAFALFRPVGAVFCAPARLVFHLWHLSAQTDVTEEDLLNLVDDVEEQSLIDENQKEMITNIVELDDVTAGEIMTHRTELVGVPQSATAAEAVQLAAKEGVSRLPVYRKTLDDIVGILYVKDLFRVWDDAARNDVPVEQFLRTAMFVPEACRARDLLIAFRTKHTQIAVVVDEYGGTSGVVTMEDVLEEIVGNIQDEFDNEDEELALADDGAVIAAGSADLEDVFKALGLPVPEDNDDTDDFESVGGLMIDRLGRIPTADEHATITHGGVRFTVLKAGERRIEKIKCEALLDDD
ncbi:MAG: hemolysin family protein, partial [Ruthenibacterium sp.]